MRVKNAFSLVELSIVLVILGLLVGGVLSGQALIRAAELRKVISNAHLYQTAILTFRDKYFALPGDLPNALSFWPSCTNGSGYYCNGDGNGLIDSPIVGGSVRHESVYVFEHLSLAGLIPGKYTAMEGGSQSANFKPVDPFFGDVLIGYYNGGESWWPDDRLGHLFTYTRPTRQAKTEDIWNLDVKLDDGKAFSGSYRVMWEEIPDPGCVDKISGNYLMENTSDYCTVYYFQSF